MKSVEREFGTATFKLETGRMAKQANGSVLVTYGDTVVLVAATAEKGSGGGKDFFPLAVFYVEKAYASDAQTQIKTLLEESKIWKTTHQDFPSDVQLPVALQFLIQNQAPKLLRPVSE